MSDELEMETCEVTVRYDPDKVTINDIEDHFHESVHHVEFANIVFTNVDRFEFHD